MSNEADNRERMRLYPEDCDIVRKSNIDERREIMIIDTKIYICDKCDKELDYCLSPSRGQERKDAVYSIDVLLMNPFTKKITDRTQKIELCKHCYNLYDEQSKE